MGTRTFCFCVCIYRLLFSDYVEPVNIGNPHEIAMKYFAEEIIKLTITAQKVIYKDLAIDDPMQRQPDISLAKKLLDWEPRGDRAKRLKINFNYFKNLSQEELYKSEHKNFENHIKQ